MKSIRSLLGIAALSSLSLLTLGHVQAQPTLRMAYVAPPPVWGPIAERFAKEVADRTQGQLKIQSFGAGQLGNLPQNYAGLRTGQIDMMLADTGTLALARDGKDFNALFAPYVFRDNAHFRAFIQSDTFRQMLAPVEQAAGFKYVGYVSDRPPRQLTTSNRKVMTPDDMKGLKVRVPETPAILEVMKGWGASPTPVPAAELYLAMKQGLVDGQDNGFDAIAGAKYFEVQKYAMKIDYIQSGLMVLMAADKWARLSPTQQKAMTDAAAATEQWASPMTWEVAEKSIATIKASGMEVVEPDLAAFRRAADSITTGFDGQLWSKGTFEKIRAVK
ncbi:MAG: TRAP transporter substrate-binding protein [Hydrogenophaga sp.]|uniref:TRAP transporter substrate-binding protein n=1 Tax=Hydrogenophaga sp. TaxID=1904254 RepID=UPI002AB83C2B|nr:TRAP transporter substrate-binding protein [Hydrogenophaga sp.]MDZ4280622.1 TRAP transporter substrate-binding protein [Hydrogenophaga sp.]